MSYDIVLSPEFIDRIRKFQKNIQKGILSKIEILAEHPLYGRPLHGGLKGLWELKLSKIRIFYTINHEKKSIRIVTADFGGKLF